MASADGASLSHRPSGDSGEAPAVRERHTAYFLMLAQRTEPELFGPRQLEAMRRLDIEADNHRAALRWAVEAGDPETELRLVASLWDYWWMRGHLREGQRLVEGALERSGVLDLDGVDADAVRRTGELVLLGGGQPVGEIRAAF